MTDPPIAPGRMNSLTAKERTLVLTATAVVFCFTILYGWTHVTVMDFSSFVRSAVQWRTTGDPYGYPLDGLPNLNAPLSVVTVFSWLPLFPESTGYLLWTLISVICFVWACVRIAAALRLSSTAVVWTVALCVLTVPARSAWMQGQVTWVFLPLLTEAWLAGRRGDAWSAGAWLAPVIALKPSLAPFALVLPWRTSILAAAGSAAATLVSVLILGVGPFQAWLALQSWINWAAAPANASLWALAARLHHWRLADVSLASLPRVEVLLIALVCAGLALPILKTRGDRRWVLAHLWSTLVSPLGWTQYLPWIAGPLLGLRTWPPAFRVVLIGFFVPSSAISAASGDLAPLFGSINAILVFMSFALLAPIPGMTRIDPRETETTAALQGRNRRESPPSH